jgi:hypothetical protein
MTDGYICSSCGYRGKPQTRTQGNILIEIILWFFFLIPGLIYSIWRMASRKKVCPKCNLETMIPLNSPIGQKMLKETKKYDQEPDYHQPSKEINWGKWIVVVAVLIPIIYAFSVVFSSPTSTPPSSTPRLQENTEDIKTLPVKELVSKTEAQVKKDYADLITDYQEGTTTPSGKIRITGFDMGSAINVQVDYNIATGKPYYIGYHFTNGVEENTAWNVVGFSKPTSASIKKQVMNWENIENIKPFKNVTLIYNPDNTVGKIAISMEDLATAQSSNSLYFVR